MQRVGPIVVMCLLMLALPAQADSSGDENWVWHSRGRQERALRDSQQAGVRNSYDNKYRRELFAREREPTTKRPLPGEPENDEIEDYADLDAKKPQQPSVGTRQYNPYGGGGGGGGLFNAGQFAGAGGGFGPGAGAGAYPSSGYGGIGAPAVLVGPGGPTGIIGRPQQQPFPGGYQPNYGGFNGAQNGVTGFPAGFGAGGNAGTGYGGYPTGPGAFGGYPNTQSGFGQYPAGTQYPFGQYPGQEYGGNQYPTGAGAQYPGIGQYPGNQFAGSGPQYTEGYGLATANGQLGIYGGAPGFGYGSFGYDENSTKRNGLVPDGKSAKSQVQGEGRSAAGAASITVNDKLNKQP